MTDVQYWEDTLTNDIEKLERMVDKCGRISNTDDKLSALQKTEKKLRQANQTKRSLKMEIRLITDVAARRQYEQTLQKLDESLKHVGADVRALRTQAEREQLMSGGNHENGADQDYTEDDYVKQGDSLLGKAAEVQDRTQESLTVIKRTVAESKEVGVSTLDELERQRGVIENIDREADRIDDNLQRAEKLVKAFGKRMASDKFIQCFTVINVLLLVGVVAYAIFGNGSLSFSSRDGGSPENPIGTR